MTKHEFTQRIYQETYKVCRSFESCLTFDQLEVARKWADGVTERWNFFVKDWRQKKCNDVTPNVKAAIDKMSMFYQHMEEKLNPKEKEPKAPKPVVVTGFC